MPSTMPNTMPPSTSVGKCTYRYSRVNPMKAASTSAGMPSCRSFRNSAQAAAKAEEVFWKYEIGGYNIPYRIELVSAEGKYCLRSVNSRTGTYYGSCELPTEKLPEDIDECFKFTGLLRNDPGLII